MSARIPTIDIGPFLAGNEVDKQKIASRFDAAARDLGFIVVGGHGIDPRLIADMHRVSCEFFDLPVAEKCKLQLGLVSNYHGYVRLASEILSYSVDGQGDRDAIAPDLKENFEISPFDYPKDDPYYTDPYGEKFFRPNQWPEGIPGFRNIWERYFREAERLSFTVMRICALALGLEEDYFQDKIDRHFSHLSVNHYPRQETDLLPGQLRAGAHTDFGSITILHPGEYPEGLQVQDAGGDWHDVDVGGDCFVVNLGDMMQQWTNDVWRSSVHRVVNPRGVTRAPQRRTSIAFFQQPNYDAVIECLPTCRGPDSPPKYARTTSGKHFDMKVARMRGIDVEAA